MRWGSWMYGLFYLSLFAVLFNMCDDGGIKYVDTTNEPYVTTEILSGTLQDKILKVVYLNIDGEEYSVYTTQKYNPEYLKSLNITDIDNKITKHIKDGGGEELTVFHMNVKINKHK